MKIKHCEKCGGEGVIENKESNSYQGDDGKWIRVIKSWGAEPCPDCGGTGHIIIEE